MLEQGLGANRMSRSVKKCVNLQSVSASLGTCAVSVPGAAGHTQVCSLNATPLPAKAAAPGEALTASIAWGGKEGMQDRQARAQGSLTDAAMSIWKRASSRLFDLEAKIVTQVSPGQT